MTTIARRSGQGLAIALVAASLLLPYVGGFPAAYLMMALTLLMIAWLFVARPRVEMGAGGWCLLAAMALLALAFLMDGTIAYAANFVMLALVVPLTAALRTQAHPRNAQVLARLALMGVSIGALVALWQVMVEGRGRALGFGSDEIWSAVAALIIGWLTLIGRPGAEGHWRWLYLLGPVLATLVVLLSGSRGPMLAVPLLMGVAFALMKGQRRELFVVLLAVAALFVLWPDKSRLQSFSTIGGELAQGVTLSDGSFDVRKVLLDASWDAFKLSPWTGYGWSHFAEATAPFTGRSSWVERADAFHLHSDPLNFAVAGGVVGLLAYLLILAAPLIGAWRTPADGQQTARKLGSTLLVACYAGSGLTNTFFGFELHTTLYACLMAMLLGYCRDEAAGQKA